MDTKALQQKATEAINLYESPNATAQQKQEALLVIRSVQHHLKQQPSSPQGEKTNTDIAAQIKGEKAQDLGVSNEEVYSASRGKYGLSEEEMMPVPKKQEKKETSFIEKTQESLRKRQVEYSKSMEDYLSGKINWAEFALHTGGKAIAAPVLDTLGNIVETVTPTPVQEAFESIVDPLLQTKFIQDGIKYYNENTTERERKNIESGINMFMAAPSRTAVQKGFTKPVIRKLEKDIAKKKRNQFKEGLMKPNTPTEAKDLTGRSFAERPELSNAYDYMATNKNASPNKSAQYNIDVINKDFAKTEVELFKEVGKNNSRINLNDIRNNLDMNADYLRNTERVVNQKTGTIVKPELDKQFDKYLQEIDMILDKYTADGKTITAKNVLHARRDFDKWIKAEKNRDLSPDADTALDYAARTFRSSMNDVINKSVGGDKVKTLLRKESAMYTAKDLINPKASAEYMAKLGMKEKLFNLMMRHPYAVGGLFTAGGGLAGATLGSPGFLAGAAIGGTAYGLTKVPYRKATKGALEAVNALSPLPTVRGGLFYGEED